MSKEAGVVGTQIVKGRIVGEVRELMGGGGVGTDGTFSPL